MIEMTVTKFSRNLKNVLDMIEYMGEEIILLRNKNKIARIIPGSPKLTAQEAMSDLFRTLPEDAAADWVKESRLKNKLSSEMKNRWDS